MNTAGTLTYNVLYRLLNIVIVYGILVLVSRMAGVEGYGLLSLMIVNANVFNLVSAFGADAGITYHTANGALQPGKIISIVFFVVGLQVLVLAVLEFASFQITGYYLLFKSNVISYWWIGFLFLLSISLTEKYTALFNGYFLFVLYSKWLLFTNAMVLLFFAVLFFYHPGYNPAYLFFLYVSLYFLQSVVLMIVFHTHVKDTFRFSFVNRDEIKAFLSFSVITLITNFVQFLAYRMDYWFIEHYRGEKELGWYSFAVKLVQAFWILPLLFAGILFTQVAKQKEKYEEATMLLFVRILFALNLVMGIACFFMVRWIIPLVFGDVFSGSILPFQILLPGIILFCFTTVLAAYFAGKGLLRVNLMGSAICFFSILVLDLVLIPHFGMKGAAVASSIGYSMSCIYSVSVYCRQTSTPLYHLFYPRMSDLYNFRALLYKIIIKKT